MSISERARRTVALISFFPLGQVGFWGMEEAVQEPHYLGFLEHTDYAPLLAAVIGLGIGALGASGVYHVLGRVTRKD